MHGKSKARTNGSTEDSEAPAAAALPRALLRAAAGRARPRTVAEVGQPGPRLGLLASGVTRVLVFFDVLKFFHLQNKQNEIDDSTFL